MLHACARVLALRCMCSCSCFLVTCCNIVAVRVCMSLVMQVGTLRASMGWIKLKLKNKAVREKRLLINLTLFEGTQQHGLTLESAPAQFHDRTSTYVRACVSGMQVAGQPKTFSDEFMSSSK